MPNGAQSLIRTLVDAGVSTCFTNPGTTEMFTVEAIDAVPEMRAVLTLFEGVATGAADGYARMSGKPASTLLHLGPGLANGLANLHNARRAKVPLVNIVGDHAQDHLRYDPPLRSDIETVARSVSTWVRTSTSSTELARDAAEAVSVATGPPGQVATLIVPANVTWEDGGTPAPPLPPARTAVPTEMIESVAKQLRLGRPTALLMGGPALQERGVLAAGRIAAATGTRLLAERTAPRIERGAGLPAVERLPYWPELVSAQLEGLEHLILADTPAPIAFFGYEGEDGYLVPPGCQVHNLTTPTCDVVLNLEALADALDAPRDPSMLQPRFVPGRPSGALTAETVGQAIGATLPEGAIIADESLTSGGALARTTAGGPRHTWLPVAGGALGQGMPAAVGAAIACPDRPVFALEGDGATLYAVQSLWTMAREQLNVTVIVFNNRAYRMISTEFSRQGKAISETTRSVSDLGNPNIDFAAVAAGFGVESIRVDDAEQLTSALERAIDEPGPHLIETVIPAV